MYKLTLQVYEEKKAKEKFIISLESDSIMNALDEIEGLICDYTDDDVQLYLHRIIKIERSA